ncbi:ferric-dicitrate binding protein FerR (iron transport regulator) [Bacteroides reticulotermitis]|uniref:Ferric-dicitrate binding protein FerR (Iron transport regulator) n=1 Tax=Bacteroides reticulotermitis TaxID=1133319 RepID=A0A840D1E2_9BACE|nr:FecR domain-containing protein [Bacteroides reticulotermitis]MBB4044208.1 ferric-dicitrate binding protein FerR (iron transport regulator) [Bacteroides reticulotermitis]
MGKDSNDCTHGDLPSDLKLKAFIEHGTPAEIDISVIKKKAFLKIHQQERKSKQRRVLMYVASTAATLLLLIGIRYIVTENVISSLPHTEVMELVASVYDEEVEVPIGDRMTLMLADGTKIIANSRTIIRYPKRFEGDYREVYVKGEAYFDVAHDAEHPFLVYSDNFSVKVLGTKFNVNNYDASDSQVVLVQGSVELKTANNDRVRMKPSELVSLQEGSFAEKRAVDTDEYICWMQGMINLDGESVESVAQRLSHYYGVTILFDDEMVAERFYGKLMLSDHVNETLRAIETMTQTRIKVHGDTIYLVKK